MDFEGLTVKLKDGSTLYFHAGAALGDNHTRVDLLREAIDTASEFRSVDVYGNEQVIDPANIEHYFLGSLPA